MEENDTAILVIVRIEDQRAQRRVRIAGRGRDPLNDRPQQLGHAFASLRRYRQNFVGREPEDTLEFILAALGISRGQVDFVQDRHDLEIIFECLVAIGQRLGLNALTRVDEENGTFARRERPRHFVPEVDVSGRVDQLENVVFEMHADVLRLDRDAAFALNVHGIEVLSAHEARINGTGDLQDPVGQRRLSVVHVGNNREITDSRRVERVRYGSHGPTRLPVPPAPRTRDFPELGLSC